jgi:hypothetical protein
MHEYLGHFAAVTVMVVTIVGLPGCGDQPSQVDTTPFLQAIDVYLERSNMAMAIKQVKEGPVLDGDTARLTASLSHRDLGGPAVTWTFHFNRQQDGQWSVVKHE